MADAEEGDGVAARPRVLVCAQCEAVVVSGGGAGLVKERFDGTLRSAVYAYELDVLGAEGVAAYSATNPGGHRFDVVRARAEQCAARPSGGAPTAEHSWFPPFAWRGAACPGCSGHIGWTFYDQAEAAEAGDAAMHDAQGQDRARAAEADEAAPDPPPPPPSSNPVARLLGASDAEMGEWTLGDLMVRVNFWFRQVPGELRERTLAQLDAAQGDGGSYTVEPFPEEEPEWTGQQQPAFYGLIVTRLRERAPGEGEGEPADDGESSASEEEGSESDGDDPENRQWWNNATPGGGI